MTHTPYMSLWWVGNQFYMYPLHLETTIAYAGWVMTPPQRYSSLNGQGLDFILFSAVYQDDLAGPFVSQPPKLFSMYIRS